MVQHIYNETPASDHPSSFASDRLPYRVVVPAGWTVVEMASDGNQFDMFASDADEQTIAVMFFTIAQPRLYEETEEAFLKGRRIE